MIPGLLSLFILITTLSWAVRQYREDRRLGRKIEVAKSLVTTAACIALTILMVGSILLFGEMDQIMAGLILGAFFFIDGMTWITAEIPRRWPPPPGAPGIRISRRGAVRFTLVLAALSLFAMVMTWNHDPAPIHSNARAPARQT